MKVLYIKLTDGYSDDFTYQENSLPPKFVQLGHETHLFVSPRSRDKSGNRVMLKPNIYQDKNRVWVHILPFSKVPFGLGKKLDIYSTLYDEICKLAPDFIFVHGLQFYSVTEVARYKKKHPDVKVVVDNHADYIIMPLDTIKHKIIQKVYYKGLAKKIEPYVNKFYGVSPIRAEYLNRVYGIDSTKIGIITQGGDENIVQLYPIEETRKNICYELGIEPSKLLIVSGAGNIDKKKNLYELMKAVGDNTEAELIMFGTFTESEKERSSELLDKTNIHYIGKIPGPETYRYFVAADVAVFPGQHSVFWDQVVSCGTPLIVKRTSGMDYFDVNGNCVYLEKGICEEITKELARFEDKSYRSEMKTRASGKAKKVFSYIEIARKIIDIK